MKKMQKQYEFERGGYFYNMASAFLVAMCGLKSMIDPSNPIGLKDDGTTARLDGKVHPGVTVDVYSLHINSIVERIDPGFIVSSLCTALVITAYAAVEYKKDRSPLFEFFRHIRNAAAHNNRFNFKGDEPRHHAEWRGKIIDHTKTQRDNPLYGKNLFADYFGPADPLLLLWDIEQYLLGIN